MRRFPMLRVMAAAVVLLSAAASNARAQAVEYQIDPVHSSAHFSVRHLMISNVRGEFAKVTGTVIYDPKNLKASSVEATIDATSINTHEPKRDDHLKSPDFFDVAKFPTLTFKSKRVEKAGKGKLRVRGDLTIRGVTREVVLEVEGTRRIVGIKNVTINEPFFQGHFPGHPIMPGVLIIEAMAQVGGMLLLGTTEDPDQKVVYFMSLDNVKFRRPVLPGDQLRCELEMLQNRGRTCRMKGVAYVDGNIVAEAEMMARVVDR